MGGRGGKSGLSQESGFLFRTGGRLITVHRTASGATLINGSYRDVDYNKMRENAKKLEGYRDISADQLKAARDARYKNYKSHDYELRENGQKPSQIKRGVYRPKRNKW